MEEMKKIRFKAMEITEPCRNIILETRTALNSICLAVLRCRKNGIKLKYIQEMKPLVQAMSHVEDVIHR